MKSTTLPFGLKRFILTMKHTSEGEPLIQRMLSAKSKVQAWSKFATQYFGPLKPNPKDWIIQEVQS